MQKVARFWTPIGVKAPHLRTILPLLFSYIAPLTYVSEKALEWI